jgi:hypothetical protein
MQQFINRSKCMLGILLVFLSSACQAEVISHTAQKLERYAVNTKDLPEGWAFSKEDWNIESGKDSYAAAYGVPNKDIVGLSQVIYIYPDEEQTQLAYSEQEKKWFSEGREWPGAEFTPLDTNDKYRYVCLQIFFDKSIVSCRFLQKHNNIVVLILVNVDGKSMTLMQFNEILKVLDKRLNTVTLD